MEHKFHDVKIGPHVIMPNHIHFIIEKTDDGLLGDHTGSPLQNTVDCVEKNIFDDHSLGDHTGSPLQNAVDCAEKNIFDDHSLGDHTGSPLQNAVDCAEKNIFDDHSSGDHTGSPLRNIVGWFKTMTTNEYIRNVKLGLYEPFEKRLWQRNYYEHIIRDEREYYTIVEYIQNNPARWEQDSLYTEASHP